MHPVLIADALHGVIAGTHTRLIAIFAGFTHAAAPAALDAVWQGALVAVALVLCLRLAPRVSAAHRFAIWASAFAMVAALPFLPFILHASASAGAQTSALGAVTAKPWMQLDSRWGLLVALLWLTASALRAADLIFHSLRLRRLWKSASPVAVDAGLLSTLARAFPARRSIEICRTRALDRPSVIGFLAPRILIPDWLFERMTSGELEHVVLHEAEHLRRRDDWTNLLQKLSLVLFPLNPALIWMERRLCREREMACDEGVVRRTRAPRAYAACLASLAERSLNRRVHALSLGAFERRPELVQRVHSILWRKRALHPLAARAWVGAVACGLLLGAVELARCPQVVAFVPAKGHAALHGLASASVLKKSAAPGVERAALLPAHQAHLPVAAAQSASAERFPASAQYRAIETRAILPARRSLSAPLVADSRRIASEQFTGAEERLVGSLEKNASVPRQVLLKAEEPGAAPSAREAAFIVFTAWEQVRTLPRRDAPVADYDTEIGNHKVNREADGSQQSQSAAQITVTRVILALYPAHSAPQTGTKQANGLHSSEAPAIPFDGGWLVFQL